MTLEKCRNQGPNRRNDQRVAPLYTVATLLDPGRLRIHRRVVTISRLDEPFRPVGCAAQRLNLSRSWLIAMARPPFVTMDRIVATKPRESVATLLYVATFLLRDATILRAGGPLDT